MSDYIPHELLIEILTRLPAKSLLRFTSVCKSWYSLITNPSFITTHLNHTISSNKNNETLLLRYYDRNEMKENYTVRHDDETFGEQFSQLEFPFKSPIGYFRIVGCCNGLICLSDDLFGDMESIILWNPSIRKSVTLQMPSKPQSPHMFVLGFGVCPVTNDHKVVRIVYLKDLLHNNFMAPPEVEVYSLSRASWRSVNANAPPCYMLEFTWSQAFLFGAVHWITYDKHVEGGSHNLIVSFDMGDEVFREMMLPHTLTEELVTNLSVTVLGESLAALNHNKESAHESCCVWVMKEYGVAKSWSKLFTISLPGTLRRTIGFRKNGEVILSLSHNELVSYEPNTRQIKDLGIQGNIRSFYTDTYVETLVLLKGQNGIGEGLLNPFEACAEESAVEG